MTRGAGGARKIYDTLLFDSEFALLEHRLAEIYDLVDVIVVVEAAQTFRGEPKPLHFSPERARFAWADAKLRHVVLPRLAGDGPWQREAFQRDAIQLGLRDARPDDVVLILDADEIPSRALLERLRRDGLAGPHRLTMTRHYGGPDFLAPRSACCPSPIDPFPQAPSHMRPEDWHTLTATWHGHSGVAVTARDITGDVPSGLPPRSPDELRRDTLHAPRLPDAGRHLNAMGSAEQLREKLSHLSHVEHAEPRALSPAHLLRARRHHVHARGWWYAERPNGPLPDDLARLEARIGDETSPALPGAMARRLVRTWSWMRLWPRFPDGLVRWIDRDFEALAPFLLPVLLTADGVRVLLSWWISGKPQMRASVH